MKKKLSRYWEKCFTDQNNYELITAMKANLLSEIENDRGELIASSVAKNNDSDNSVSSVNGE